MDPFAAGAQDAFDVTDNRCARRLAGAGYVLEKRLEKPAGVKVGAQTQADLSAIRF
jgi:hypothetical protein